MVRTPGTPGTAATMPAGSVAPAGTAAAPQPPPSVEKTYLCREYAIFKVDPEDAHVFVDGVDEGHASKWDDGRGHDKFLFRAEGVHYVRLYDEDYKPMWLKFIVNSTAAEKEVTVEVKLDKKKN